jgi:hypothetical protein
VTAPLADVRINIRTGDLVHTQSNLFSPLGSTQPRIQRVSVSFPRGKDDRGVKVIAHLNLVPMLTMHEALFQPLIRHHDMEVN